MSTSSNKHKADVNMGWESKERDRIWWKTDCVKEVCVCDRVVCDKVVCVKEVWAKEFCLKELCANGFVCVCVWKNCVWKSGVWQCCVWKTCVWQCCLYRVLSVCVCVCVVWSICTDEKLLLGRWMFLVWTRSAGGARDAHWTGTNEDASVSSVISMGTLIDVPVFLRFTYIHYSYMSTYIQTCI